MSPAEGSVLGSELGGQPTRKVLEEATEVFWEIIHIKKREIQCQDEVLVVEGEGNLEYDKVLVLGVHLSALKPTLKQP